MCSICDLELDRMPPTLKATQVIRLNKRPKGDVDFLQVWSGCRQDMTSLTKKIIQPYTYCI